MFFFGNREKKENKKEKYRIGHFEKSKEKRNIFRKEKVKKGEREGEEPPRTMGEGGRK